MAMTLDLNVWVMTLDDVYSTTTDCLKCMLLLSVHQRLCLVLSTNLALYKFLFVFVSFIV